MIICLSFTDAYNPKTRMKTIYFQNIKTFTGTQRHPSILFLNKFHGNRKLLSVLWADTIKDIQGKIAKISPIERITNVPGRRLKKAYE